MGVTSIIQWPVSENKSVQQTVDFLTKKVEFMGATKTGTFCVDCETFHSTGGPSKHINVVHNSEHPVTCFAVTDNNHILISDTGFDSIMQRLKPFYSTKMAGKIESKGKRYQLGDFVIKVGIVSIGPSNRGILLEVEYTPCVTVKDCWKLLTEFMQGFLGSRFQLPIPPCLASRQDMQYTAMDTVNQYLEQFNNFRKVQNAR